MYKGEVPFVRLLIPLIAGILIAYNFGHNFIYTWTISILFFKLALFLILLKLYKKYHLYRLKWVFGLLIHFFIVFLSYSITVHYSGKFDSEFYGSLKSDLLLVKIVNEPKWSSGIIRFESEVEARYLNTIMHKSRGKLMLSIRIDSTKNNVFQYGDLLLVPSNYKEIESAYNPGEFDYKSYLESKQIYFQLLIEEGQVKKIAKNMGNPIISDALLLRKKLVDKYTEFIEDKEAAALVSALILGYRADLSKDLVQAYSKTGTMHVLSVSGMHVGIVFLVLSFLLKKMDRNKSLIILRAFLIIGLICFYSLITGFSPSVCRSALMLSFVVLGKAINKNQNTYNLMAISAFFLLIYDPYYLFDVGFQLSYLAVAGLIYFQPIIYNSIYIKNKLLDAVWSYSALSLAAQIATFPISLYYFHQFPIYFLLSNLLIMLPVAIIMYLGIAFLFIPFDLINKFFGACLNWLVIFTNNILYEIEKLPFSALEGLWINVLELLLISALIILFVFWYAYRYKSIVWTFILTCLFLALSISLKSIQNFTKHELVFYSLKKNTAIGYLNPQHSIILTDIDSLDKLLNYATKPYFSMQGIKEIKYLRLGNSYQSSNYWISPECMQFGFFKVLRWNSDFKNLDSSNKIAVDIVLIPNLKSVNLNMIKNQVTFNTLVFESNIPDFKINKLIKEAKDLNINFISLKKNVAHIVTL